MMMGSGRPSSAPRRTGTVAVLRTSRSQPAIASSRSRANGRPASVGGGGSSSGGGGGATKLGPAIKSERDEASGGNSRRGGAGKVINWFRLPATGGWVPTARAGHTAVTVGTDMVMFGGIVNGHRTAEVARFDLTMRAWHRLTCHGPHNSSNNIRGGERALTPVTPTPRAFHVSWEFDADLYVHGGEGSMGVQNIDNGGVGGCGANINAELEGLLEGVGRDPFAEEDGGVPLERGRVVVGGGGLSGHRGGARGDKGISHASQRQERDNVAVTILEDVWKLDVRTHQWERLSSRLAPLGRKGHVAAVAPLREQPHVFIFGGVPRGRLGLSNALYSVDLSRLSIGEGTWKRHRPGGVMPLARQGHSFTVVGGGKRLVLYGGVGESGELLNDVQILDIDGGQLSWAQVQTPVGDVPMARQGHSACEVPASACYAAGISSGLGCVLIFGGEGRTDAGPEEVRRTDSHQLSLYDPQESRWHEIGTGHAFPIGRHGHSMAAVATWTPPSFRPDGTLAFSDSPPTISPPAEKHRRADRAQLESEAATHQWGSRPPKCAIIFGGLNSMYVNPEVWVLPIRWREKTVQLCPPSPEAEDSPVSKPSFRGAVFAKAIASNVATKARAITAPKRGNLRVGENSDKGFDSWRLWKGDGERGGFRGEGGGIRNLGVEEVVGAPLARGSHRRRASLPATSIAARGFNACQRLDVAIHDDARERADTGSRSGRSGTTRDSEQANGGMKMMGDTKFVAEESAKDIEEELLRLRKAAYMAEQKLSAEAATRMQLEDEKGSLQNELVELRAATVATEVNLRNEAKRHWSEGQKAKAQCGNLERLLAEAYELINTTELQHHLQMRYFMPDLYGNSQRMAVRPVSPTTAQLPAGVSTSNLSSTSCRLDSAGDAGRIYGNRRNEDTRSSPQRQHNLKHRYRKLGDDILAPAVEKTCCEKLYEDPASMAAARSSVVGVEMDGLD